MNSMLETPPLVGIGDLAADIVIRIEELPVHGDAYLLADSFELEAGGTANFLITAARLGAPAAAIGSLGDDVWGHEVSRILQAEHVDTSLITPSGSSTRVVVLAARDGSHSFLGTFGTGAPGKLDHEHRETLRTAGAVFTSGYSLNEQHLAELTIQALAIAGEQDVIRAFDPGPSWNALGDELKKDSLELTDILLLTADELRSVSPGGIDALFCRGIQTVVLKLGASGCEVHTSAGEVFRHPGFQVPVVDTTAAGDSFAAGFLRALTADLPLDQCAMFANAVGAVKVQKPGGGRNVPTAQEISHLLEEAGQHNPLELA